MTPEQERAADQAQWDTALTGADYHCPCGWSTIHLPWRTAEETRAAHDQTDVHRIATGQQEAYR